MNIVLTNDDGFDAPGIAALRAATETLGRVVVVAPRNAHSGCGHAATTASPIRVEQNDGVAVVDGAPVDCARLALLEFEEDVDWLLSGINDGANLGVDLWMSGTAAAAREAALLGVPAIAISHYHAANTPIDWRQASRVATDVIRELINHRTAPNEFWNVNLPAQLGDEASIVWCDVDPHPLPVRYEQLDGAFHYAADYHQRQRRPGADVDVCFGGDIAVSRVPV